ncbi:MAG: endonuclease/exonuclease/phosphatase family protein [Egibacteraceae bacterium]
MIGGSDPPAQLAFFPIDTPSLRCAAVSQLRLLTWNVQHAAPTRARRQAAWLAGCDDADVLVLTEVRDAPGGQALIQALGEYGYQVIVPDSSDGEYLVVVAARVGGLEALPVRLGHLPARFVAARVTLGAHTVGVVGLYVPSRGPQERRNEDKRAFQQAVSAQLPRLATDLGRGPIVVAGDLNVVEPEHQPHYAVFGEWEYRFYTDFAAHHVVDAFRALHPAAVEHSWSGRGGNGYRFDHAFVTGQHRGLLRASRYLHQPRLEGLSDHSAMTVTLALDG